jgi:4-aminobutyrate aminotransferase
LANLDYILSHDLQSNALKVGNYLREQLRARAENSGVVGEIRGKGLMVAVELVEPGTLIPNPIAAQRVLETCRRGGVLIGKGGLHNNVLRIAPPMSVTMDEASTAVDVLTAALHDADETGHEHNTKKRISV